MTQIEMRFMNIVPNELRGIREQLELLNENLAIIAKNLKERK